MKYIVYNKKGGQIIRSYRKIKAESGECIPASESEILSDLPPGFAKIDVGILALENFSFERGKNHKVDVKNKKVISFDRNKEKVK